MPPIALSLHCLNVHTYAYPYTCLTPTIQPTLKVGTTRCPCTTPRSFSKDDLRRSMILRNGGKTSGGDRDRDQDRGGGGVRNTLTAHRKWLHDISDQVGHMVV